jgi:hypothetical protein
LCNHMFKFRDGAREASSPRVRLSMKRERRRKNISAALLAYFETTGEQGHTSTVAEKLFGKKDSQGQPLQRPPFVFKKEGRTSHT